MALASAGATSYVVALSVPYPSGTLARWVASTWMPNDLQREEHRSRGRSPQASTADATAE